MIWNKIGLLLGIFLFTGGTIHAQAILESFTLKDQHDIPQKIQFPSSKSLIFIVGDRDTSAQTKSWQPELSKSIGKKADYIIIAALGSVPEFLRGVTKSSIHSERSVLLDWDNAISRKLGYLPKKCSVVGVNSHGVILAHENTYFSPEKMKRLCDALGI